MHLYCAEKTAWTAREKHQVEEKGCSMIGQCNPWPLHKETYQEQWLVPRDQIPMIKFFRQQVFPCMLIMPLFLDV